jgi:hypothetical protein
MNVINPITITDAILTGSNVPEADCVNWSITGRDFALFVSGTSDWCGMCCNPLTGDVYANVTGGSIWKQTGGSGAFADLVTGNKNWRGMCATPTGNIYACVSGGSIWMQTGGSGAFADLGTGNKIWYGMCCNPLTGDVYACVYDGSIWMQTGGSGAFADLATGNKYWKGMCCNPLTGDVYACVSGGSIWMQTGGSGAFADLGTGNKSWVSMCCNPLTGDVFATVSGGSIWMQTEGSGAFADLTQSVRSWTGICASSTGNIYACVSYGSIYRRTGDTNVMVTTPNIHKIYESLTHINFAANPVIDTASWLETGSTNRWKCFNSKLSDQTEQATSIIKVFTPGESFDSASLFNLESDTVDIVQIDSAAALLNEIAWTGASGTTQSTGWNKVGTPSDYTIDGGMIRITADAASEGQSKTVAVTPGTEYQLLVIYKNTSGGDLAQIGIYDNTHSANILATTDLTSSTVNAPFSYVFTAPAGCTSVEAKIMAKANTDVVWFGPCILSETEYNETVTTGASKFNIVKTDIPEIATGIITVTINKSGTAAVGELIIGNTFDLGTLLDNPSIETLNFSKYTEDAFGGLDLLKRGYAKKINCVIRVSNVNLDAIDKYLDDHKDDMLVWIIMEAYSCFQVYGFCKSHRKVYSNSRHSILSLEIRGVI